MKTPPIFSDEAQIVLARIFKNEMDRIQKSHPADAEHEEQLVKAGCMETWEHLRGAVAGLIPNDRAQFIDRSES